MWRYSKRLRSLYETPQAPEETEDTASHRKDISEMLDSIRHSGRTILTEYESKQVLSAYGIEIVDTRLAKSADEAVAVANEIGYPVVIKLNSETITHKTDVGGVRLDLVHAKEVKRAYKQMETAVTEKYGPEHFLGVTVQPMVDLSDGYELIVGSSPDSQFGPVLLFGTGGTLVEVFKDRALGLPPLNTTLARRMMERTKIYRALQGIRGRDPVDMDALEKLMVRFSYLVVEQPWIKELDINPLLASSDKLLALDGRVVLYEPEVKEVDLPQLAIRPYPSQYIFTFTNRKGNKFVIRPIRPEDEPEVVEFHQGLSEQSIYLRYFRSFQLSQRVQHERLTRICFVDYDRDMVMVVEKADQKNDDREIVGIGRLSKLHGTNDGEFAMLVSDSVQRQGIGTQLLNCLLQIGRDEGLDRVIAYMLGENRAMRLISKRLGFQFEREGSLFKAAIEL
jgi:acetyltransferase